MEIQKISSEILTWTLGHPDLFVKKIAIVWMETVIKKLPQRAPSGKKENWKEGYTLFKQKDLYRIPQALVEEIMTAVNVVCFQ